MWYRLVWAMEEPNSTFLRALLSLPRPGGGSAALWLTEVDGDGLVGEGPCGHSEELLLTSWRRQSSCLGSFRHWASCWAWKPSRWNFLCL